MALDSSLRLSRPDDFYQALIDLHAGLTEAQSAAVNARLVLLLANQVGDLQTLNEAMAAARKASNHRCYRESRHEARITFPGKGSIRGRPTPTCRPVRSNVKWARKDSSDPAPISTTVIHRRDGVRSKVNCSPMRSI
ncbi:MAG: DUF2783 domain-containing protein [Burkholderiales bacterium]|nr:DUF2783 domain-containing protein [Burkholderiales bacterium]